MYNTTPVWTFKLHSRSLLELMGCLPEPYCSFFYFSIKKAWVHATGHGHQIWDITGRANKEVTASFVRQMSHKIRKRTKLPSDIQRLNRAVAMDILSQLWSCNFVIVFGISASISYSIKDISWDNGKTIIIYSSELSNKCLVYLYDSVCKPLVTFYLAVTNLAIVRAAGLVLSSPVSVLAEDDRRNSPARGGPGLGRKPSLVPLRTDEHWSQLTTGTRTGWSRLTSNLNMRLSIVNILAWRIKYLNSIILIFISDFPQLRLHRVTVVQQ